MQEIIKKYLDRLHESINRSALLNAFPPKTSTSRLDLHRLSCLDSNLPTNILESLIYGNNESIHLQFKYDNLPQLRLESEGLENDNEPLPEELITKIDHLKQIESLHAILAKKMIRESELIYKETGLRSLWLGYPLAYLTEPSSSKKPKRILAPIFLWPIKIKASLSVQGDVTIYRDEDSGTPIYNKAFDLWCTKYLGINPDDPHKDSLVEISKADMNILIHEIFKGFTNPLELIDEDGVKPIPSKDSLIRGGKGQELLNSAILGIIKWENQSVMSNLAELVNCNDYPDVTRSLLSGESVTENEQDVESDGAFSKYFVCKTDYWQEFAILKSRLKPGIIVHGPPGTGKSETIVNIAADSLARGERVLVICQKKAAIDVVYERIKKAGLESLCALVHDSNTDRKRIIESLKGQVEESSFLKQSRWNGVIEQRKKISIEIDEIERSLDDYMKALHTSDNSIKLSYRDTKSLYSKIRKRWKGLRENSSLSKRFQNVTDYDLEKLKHSVRLIGKLFYEADPKNNPWQHRCRNFIFDKHLKDDILESLNEVTTTIENAKIPNTFKNPVLEKPENQCEFRDKLKHLVCILSVVITDKYFRLIAKWYRLRNSPGLSAKVRDLNNKIKDLHFENINTKNFELHKFFYTLSKEKTESFYNRVFKYSKKRSWIKKIFSSEKSRKKKFEEEFKSFNIDFTKVNNKELLDYFSLRLKWLDLHNYIKESELSLFLRDTDITNSDLKEDYEYINNIFLSFSDWGKIEKLVGEPLAKDFFQSLSCNDFATFSSKLKEYVTLCENIESIYKQLDAIAKLKEWLNDGIINNFEQDVWQSNFEKDKINGFLENIERLHPLIQFDTEMARLELFHKDILNIIFEELYKENAINKFNIKTGDEFSDLCVSFIELCIYYNCLARCEEDYPILASYTGQTYENKLARLKELLNEKHKLESKAIINIWNKKQNTDINPVSWKGILVAKGKNSKRLRQVVDLGAQEGLFLLRPCWMTNPNTACQIFPLIEEYFDTVIFDEASQCPTEQALPIIFRAKKVIISGDEKQLPPSAFFRSGFDVEEDEEEKIPEDEMTSEEITRKNIEQAKQERIVHSESLLDASKTILKDAYLNIHYRSQHQSLISFSNNAFYNNRLEFPFLNSGKDYLDEPPIVFKDIAGIYKDEQNRDEANYVIAILKQIWETKSRPSIGIVTFNIKQRDLILDMLTTECQKDPKFASTYEAERDRKDGNQDVGLFVKNLESVQGDERDVMLFSTTFGKDEKGKFYRRFGPLTLEGGERRLNVAITRSKKRMYIVTSMPIGEISDVITKEGKNPGTNIGGREYFHLFMHFARATSKTNKEEQKHYLDLANSLMGISSHNIAENSRADSVFEEEVAKALRSEGFIIDHQIGESGFKIDLAIRHTSEELGYILGIECDGALYHSSYSARMRDIWRQEILESRGWKIHRIWSTDWWYDQTREISRIKRIVDAIYSENITDGSSLKGLQNDKTNINNKNADDKYIEKKPEMPSEEQLTNSERECKTLQRELKLSNNGSNDRLSNAINFLKKKELSKSDKSDSERIRRIIIDLLKHGTQGKDLLADKVIRELGIKCRGKDRSKLKKNISRIVRKMETEGIVEEYKTDKRTRLKLKY